MSLSPACESKLHCHPVVLVIKCGESCSRAAGTQDPVGGKEGVTRRSMQFLSLGSSGPT